MAPGAAIKATLSFGRDQWDPSSRFETSWLLPPWVLFAFRALFAVYAFTVLFFVLGYYCSHGELGGCAQARTEFSYFTVLTYWGLAFYFLVSAVHTGMYCLSGRSLLGRFPRPLQALHSLLYTTICVYPIIVTVVYWAVLYLGRWFEAEFSAWSNISRHAMNSSFALFEILLPRTDRPPWIHLLWLIIILALYLALAYLSRATLGFYVYAFLDPQKSGSLVGAYIAGIAVGCVVIFILVWGLISLRMWIAETKLGMAGKSSRRIPPPADSADTETGAAGIKQAEQAEK